MTHISDGHASEKSTSIVYSLRILEIPAIGALGGMLFRLTTLTTLMWCRLSPALFFGLTVSGTPLAAPTSLSAGNPY